MTFQNPLEENDCAQDYQDSHLDYLCAIVQANDIEVEEAILANCIAKLGFDPSKQKTITIHIPSQLLEYASDESEDIAQCGIRDSLIINRKIDDVVLRFDRECLKWEFFLKNSTIPDCPAKVTTCSPGNYGVEADAFEENMNIKCLQMSFNTANSSTSWRFQVSCGIHWFDYVFCKVSFPEQVSAATVEPVYKEGTPLEVLNLSVRVYKTCKRAQIKFAEELAALSDKEILGIKSLGMYALEEIREKIETWRNTNKNNSP